MFSTFNWLREKHSVVDLIHRRRNDQENQESKILWFFENIKIILIFFKCNTKDYIFLYLILFLGYHRRNVLFLIVYQHLRCFKTILDAKFNKYLLIIIYVPDYWCCMCCEQNRQKNSALMKLILQ